MHQNYYAVDQCVKTKWMFMDIEVDIKKSDLIALNCNRVPRNRETWIYFGVLFFGILIYFSYKTEFPQVNFLLGLTSSFIGASVTVIVVFLWSTGFILLTADRKSGVLGIHNYTITSQGLCERTDANEALMKWSGIRTVEITKNHIFVGINSYLFHVLPRRSFSTEKEFCEFGSTLSENTKNLSG